MSAEVDSDDGDKKPARQGLNLPQVEGALPGQDPPYVFFVGATVL